MLEVLCVVGDSAGGPLFVSDIQVSDLQMEINHASGDQSV